MLGSCPSIDSRDAGMECPLSTFREELDDFIVWMVRSVHPLYSMGVSFVGCLKGDLNIVAIEG